ANVGRPEVEDPLSAAAGHTGDAHGDMPAGHGGGHGDHSGTGSGGHGEHGGGHDHVAMFRRLFWIMLALSVPTVLLSEMFASIVNYSLPDVPGLKWVAPLLGTVMYV